MLSKVMTASLYGIEGQVITVETDISSGLPAYNVVGRGDTVIREGGERIKASMINSGIPFPARKITVNLSPAFSRKEGSHFDLPMAVGIMISMGAVPQPDLSKSFFGELSMDGHVVGVKGILPLVVCAAKEGAKEVFVPAENCREASLVEGVKVYPVRSLSQLKNHLTEEQLIWMDEYPREGSPKSSIPDFKDVTGQEGAKRAVVICAAGGHGLVMTGSPGAGKTMLAKRIPGILPPLTKEEMLEITKIYSVAGLLGEDVPLITERPFRSVHSDITKAALLGGGSKPMPGEFSLAHQGVLFMDEMPLFSKGVIESLRKPLEEKEVMLARHRGNVRFPGNVILVAAANPCPCGHLGDSFKECTCSGAQLASYERKISDMIMDRIDMHARVERVDYEDIKKEGGLSTDEMAAMVLKARERQERRFGKGSLLLNSGMTVSQIEEHCPMDRESESFMKEAYNRLPLTMRTYHKVITVARTIADLSGSENISTEHLAEALQYRGGKSEI